MSTNSPDEIARLWMAQIDERLSWLDDQIAHSDAQFLAAMYDSLSERYRRMGAYLQMLADEIGHAMRHAGAETMTVDGWESPSIQVESSRRAKRTGVQRDELMRAVDRLVYQCGPHIDTSTGEVLSNERAKLDLIMRLFRLEPRWGELRKEGIDADEYCMTDWATTVRITRTDLERADV